MDVVEEIISEVLNHPYWFDDDELYMSLDPIVIIKKLVFKTNDNFLT